MHRIKDTSQPLIQANWNDLFNSERIIHQLENQVLPAYLKRMRWFGGKARAVKGMKIYQNIPIENSQGIARYLLIKVRYEDGPTEIYTLPIVFVHSRMMLTGKYPSYAVIARIEDENQDGYLMDGIYDEDFRNSLFLLMSNQSSIRGNHYPLDSCKGKYLDEKGLPHPLESKVLEADQSNSSIIFNDTFFLKLFRKVEYMVNPDWEIVNFLTSQDKFKQIPAFSGCVELTHPEKNKMLLIMLQQLVPNKGDAWKLMINRVERFYDRAVESDYQNRPLPLKPHLLSISWDKTPEELRNLIGEDTFQEAALLGKRTAEFHIALADAGANRDFEPENLDADFQKKLFKELMHLLDTKFDLLERNLQRVPATLRDDAAEMLEGKARVKSFFTKVLDTPLEGKRTRIHGDYHLGQVLVTDNDMYMLDFEGEPDKPHHERRDKYPPLKDVAGMMRSFRYAAYAVMFGRYDEEHNDRHKMIAVADIWYHFVSRYFLGAYLETMSGSGLIPADDKVNDLLQVYSFQKAIYELGYEINNRPDWALIPLQSLIKFVKHYID
ncbi:MAG: putative maltokinase [Bacteroidia bacterium]